MAAARYEKYGIRWPEGYTPLHVELALYANEATRERTPGVQSKWEHFRRAIKMHLPDSVFAWHRWVDDAGEEWCEGTELVIWGAGGTTKSGIIGAFCYFDLMAAPKTTLTVMVTNPQEKHWDRCFSKTLLWREAMPPHLKIGKVVKAPKPALLTMDIGQGSRRGILCISIEKGETGMEIGRKVGAHAPRTRLILEEGQTLPITTLEIATNLFMGSTDRKEAIIGNPMSWHNNALGAASLPMSGDTALIDDKKPDSWIAARSHGDRPGKVLVYDGIKCPSLDSPEEGKRLNFMIGEKDIALAKSKPGAENTLNFWSQIRGRIPPAGQVLTVFNELDWNSIGVSKKHDWLGGFDQLASADLSLGGDKIPIYRWGIGLTEIGKIAQALERHYITVDITKPDRSGQIGVAYAKLMLQWGIRDLKMCSADCSGLQGAIADTMERECHKAGIPGLIYRVRSEEGATERVLSHGRVMHTDGAGNSVRETAKHRYKDRATELVMNLPEAIGGGLIWGLDDEVKEQLCSRGFDETSVDGGATKVQKKKEWIDTHKGQSPDELDSVCVFLAHCFEKKFLIPGKDTRPKPEERSGLPPWMQKKMQPSTYVPRASQIASTMKRR